jgi:membrane-associated phospholipid phosphatase
MTEYIGYLSNPKIVADFQKYFGVESADHHDTTKTPKKTADHNGYLIKSKFWYYFFHFGANLGTEMFFGLLFPLYFWHISAEIARKVSIAWALHQYIGNATKEFLKIPRPKTPPVFKLEEVFVKEYGFPSTHTMTTAGLSISIAYFSHLEFKVKGNF